MKTTAKKTDATERYVNAFWKGWFSAFQPLFGTSIELPDLDRGAERDIEAIASDWRQVGDDIRWAMSQVDGR
jgi:hypothetical protein